MTSLNISLPEPLCDLIRRDQERQAQGRLEGLLLDGVKSGPASYLTKRDWAELRTDVAERLDKRRGARVKKSR